MVYPDEREVKYSYDKINRINNTGHSTSLRMTTSVDFVILTLSERADFREEKLGLPVNKEKSEVAVLKDLEFLGFQILRGKIRIST